MKLSLVEEGSALTESGGLMQTQTWARNVLPLDDVNNLQASLQLPASLASTAYSDRRNALFTSPESATAHESSIQLLRRRNSGRAWSENEGKEPICRFTLHELDELADVRSLIAARASS